ncbi:HP1 family phage holin [Klebsiella variicola subsp. variicola]|uniref:Holin n=1 Tax=Klebsiella pneumoniae TaxID=573 RepID=A0A483N787_KLEPN|nr:MULTISPECIES: HP1 family phage holin [Klebsiella/Raoultella group]HBQ3047645.1 holin [Klebsiella quasipneumoniae subsp. similipneumoniae]ASI59025.1 holin [Raoultella ornithinolytica]EKU4920308.1 holin [Klebsiella pneumoniae]ELA0473490.1 holin [Klebsiella pneumoniae]MBG2409876.1 holin [Klebsiella pneumoniae]
MGLNIEKITSFIAYWLSVALAAFGAMTPQDFAAWFGVLGVVMTVGVNWYYRRKSYLLELNRMRISPIVVAPPPKRP